MIRIPNPLDILARLIRPKPAPPAEPRLVVRPDYAGPLPTPAERRIDWYA